VDEQTVQDVMQAPVAAEDTEEEAQEAGEVAPQQDPQRS